MSEKFRRGPDDGFHVGYGQWVTHADWTASTSPLEFGDDHNEPAATPAEMLPCVTEAFAKAHEHRECERMAEEESCRIGECDHDEHPMNAAVPEPTLEGKIVLRLAERLDRHLSERDFEQGCRLACGYDGDDRSEHIAADLAAVLAPLVVEVRARAVEEAPDCLEHREVQHRDRKPPWCNTCGWNHGRAAVPPAKVGDSR